MYRGQAREYHFLNYALFVAFFPHLLAGPVLHHAEVMPQFARRETFRFSAENFAVGLTIFAVGLFKKVVLADGVGEFATPVFDAAKNGATLTFLAAWGGVLSYTFQLYFDFSGYSDMAIGLARLFGIVFPANFNSPYKAASIIDFWRRWHMTLSRFLRDYLYVPLGGGRHGQVRRHANLMITMLLGGLWHGAGWTFVVWGGLHGAYLVVERLVGGPIARLMAERTTQSWTSVPHFFLVREVDANELLEAQKVWSDGAGKSQSTAGTITDLLVALVARALGRHPRMNASWTDEGIRANRDINVSVAVAVNDGVVGVVVHKADTLEIEEISTQRRQLTERARAGRLRPADITGGTFTLSNLGMYKVDAFSAIITPPQAAVLAVGAISERVVAVEGKPAVRPMMTMTLSSDHRVVDGARAAEFLSDLAGAMREPMKLL